jgi:cell wall-associated NlpC family hydrolase
MLTRSLRRHAAGASAVLLLALALPGAPQAQEAVAPAAATARPPTGGSDAVLQLLQQRGLLSAQGAQEASGLVQQARHAASELVISAMNFLGVPYRRGGDHADEGFDCSGFTRHIFENSVGLLLPRRVDDQASYTGLARIAREELKPGDLVFFNTLKRTFSHVGIYIGEGRFIHSPRAGGAVRIEDMRMAYWDKRFTGARRAPQVNGVPPSPATLAAPVEGGAAAQRAAAQAMPRTSGGTEPSPISSH